MNKVTLSNFIMIQIEGEKALTKDILKINLIEANKKDDLEILTRIQRLLKENRNNIKVLKELCNCLELIDDENLLNEFELEDIRLLYESLCETNEYDVELHMDYFYFLYNVLEEEEAQRLYNDYKSKINNYFDEFLSSTQER